MVNQTKPKAELTSVIGSILPTLKRGERAFALEQELISKKDEINSCYFEIGKILSEIKSEGLYVELGYERITDWLSSLYISLRMAWFLIGIYEFFIVEQKMQVPTLKSVDISKLFDILPIVKANPQNLEEWVEKARNLRAIDLRKEIKELKLQERQKVISQPIITDISTNISDYETKNIITSNDMYETLKRIPERVTDLVILYPPQLFNFGLIWWALRTLKTDGQALLFVNAKNIHVIIGDLGRGGINLGRTIIWKKNQFSKQPHLNQLAFQHEVILWGAKTGILEEINGKISMVEPNLEYNLNEIQGDVFEFDIPTKYGHSEEKPVRMMEELIEMTTMPGDLVLNLCSGCGDTLVAAKRLNRRFIGIEKDNYWYKISLARLANTPVI